MKFDQKNLEALNSLRHEAFRQSVVELLMRHYGQHPAVQTDADRLRHFNAGLLKAKKYGIPLGPDAAKLIFLMLELSPSFDEDPRWPWARALLETRIANKMERLVFAASLVL